MLTSRKKNKIIKTHAVHEKDTGSTPVQIGLLTKRINELTDHLKKHSKDNHSRRGLLKMVGKRRRLLRYLETLDSRLYNQTAKKVELK